MQSTSIFRKSSSTALQARQKTQGRRCYGLWPPSIKYGAPRRGATAVLDSVKIGLVRPGSAIMALWGGHAHSAVPNLLASIFPPFFGFVFGMPFFRPFSPFWTPFGSPLAPFRHFGSISASILAPFWLILAPFGIPFSGLDFASGLDLLFLDFYLLRTTFSIVKQIVSCISAFFRKV